MEAWHDFFLGELGAAAAFAGLLFVSLSVNQARIIALPSLPARALQALTVLFAIVVVSSIMLIPDQTAAMSGGELLGVAVLEIVFLSFLVAAELKVVEPLHRSKSVTMAVIGQASALLFAISGAAIMLDHVWVGAFTLGAGTLVSLWAAGMNAWVLLIEINR